MASTQAKPKEADSLCIDKELCPRYAFIMSWIMKSLYRKKVEGIHTA